MGREKKVTKNIQNRIDIEKRLKSDKSFMNTRSAAEFEAFVDGALWMMEEKDAVIKKLKERLKNDSDKIIDLQNELAPYRELYEDYVMVKRKTKKKTKRKSDDEDDSDEENVDYNDDIERSDDFSSDDFYEEQDNDFYGDDED